MGPLPASARRPGPRAGAPAPSAPRGPSESHPWRRDGRHEKENTGKGRPFSPKMLQFRSEPPFAAGRGVDGSTSAPSSGPAACVELEVRSTCGPRPSPRRLLAPTRGSTRMGHGVRWCVPPSLGRYEPCAPRAGAAVGLSRGSGRRGGGRSGRASQRALGGVAATALGPTSRRLCTAVRGQPVSLARVRGGGGCGGGGEAAR